MPLAIFNKECEKLCNENYKALIKENEEEKHIKMEIYPMFMDWTN